MIETKLLLNTYFEKLYEYLDAAADTCRARTETLLQEEIEKRNLGTFDAQKITAYREACWAFVMERIETYNPIGIQYTFDQADTTEAFELELQLNWYDSKTEYENLVRAARKKASPSMSQQQMEQLARELIAEFGAYPNQSIIAGFETEPTLQKLPDYVVARAIEEIIHQQL